MDILDVATNGWTISGVVSIFVMLFAKFAPEEKILKVIKNPLFNLGVLVSKFLVLRIGKKATNNFETGIIKTIISVFCKAPLFFLAGMLADNETKKRKD